MSDVFWNTVTDRIYQGGFISAQNAAILRDNGVTDLLNLDIPYTDHDQIVATGLTVHWHLLPDMCKIDRGKALAIMSVLDQILSSERAIVYIHCNAGISRSPTIAWLYLLHSGMSQTKASKLVEPDGSIVDHELVAAIAKT